MTTTTDLSALTGEYVLDPDSTRIGFVARHTIGSEVRGQFDQFEGAAHLDGDDPSKSRVELTIQTASIQTRNQRRDESLHGKFLDAANHPTIIFTSTAVEQLEATTFKLTGDLTIRGVTKPVTVNFELTDRESESSGNSRVGFQGSATINRKDWSVAWAAAAGLVSKKVRLELDVAAIRRS